MTKKLENIHTFSFPNPVWKMLFQTDGSALSLEIRNQETLEATFSILDPVRKKLLLTDLAFEDSWWTNIFSFIGEYLVFYTYSDTQNPEEKNFFVVKWTTEEIIWYSDSFMVVDTALGKLYGYDKKDDDKILKEVDFFTNKIKVIGDKKIQNREQGKELLYPDSQKLLYPFAYTEGSNYFAVVLNYVAQQMNVHPVKSCEYLEVGQFIIISYYIYEHKNLVNYLMVVNKTGDLLYHEKICDNLPGVATDTFFVLDHVLIFIKDKSQVVCYEL